MSHNIQQTELAQACYAKDVEKVKRLFKDKKKFAKMLTTFDQHGQSPLTVALKNNQEDMVEFLLQTYKDTRSDINLQDKNGYAVLHQAVESDEPILMRVLQYEGINVDVRNEDINTPLHYFCGKFKSPNCQDPFHLFMDKRVNVNVQNKGGETPLHKAIFNNHVRLMMVNLLLNAGANVNLPNNFHESPLHYAVHLGREDLVNTLLKAGADLNVAGREKKTPYELACDKYPEIAKRMLKYKELYEWLREQGLEDYKEAFVKEGIFKDVLGEVTEKILDSMGITTAGHKIRILKACSIYKTDNKPAIIPQRKDVLDEEDLTQPDTDITGLRDSLHQLKHIIGDITIIKDNQLEYTEKLGAGSSGKVYRGLYNGKEVAIKILKSMTESKEIDEFKKEFQIMSAIRSKHVVLFYGAVLEPRLCMVMENCSRGSLYHVMNSEKYDIGWDKTFRFAIETARGIECLHQWNPQIVHRDLKSLNLLVNEKWEIKVCDFGLSRFNTGSNLETLVKMRGTFAYCAPEVYFGEQFSVKSDVYSIGMILWELVTRCINCRYERPFSEFKNLQHDFQIIIQTAKRNLRPTIPPKCPANFVTLIQACWDAKTENRPTCTDIVNTLLTLEQEYKSNITLWDSIISPLPSNNDNDD